MGAYFVRIVNKVGIDGRVNLNIGAGVIVYVLY